MKFVILHREQWSPNSASVFIVELLVSRNENLKWRSFSNRAAPSYLRRAVICRLNQEEKRKEKSSLPLHFPNSPSVTQSGDIAEDKLHFSVIVILLPLLILLLSPSCSAVRLQSGGSDHGSDLAWSEGKVRIPSSASG